MRHKGFTIAELLIVITVIGILAAIVVVSYSGVTAKANDAAVQSDLDAVAGLAESYKTDPNNSDEFPDDAAALATLGIKASRGSYRTDINANFIYCTDTDRQSFALVAQSKSKNIFMITEDGFKAYTLGESNFTASALCPALGMTTISSGMSAPNTWQSWVGQG